MCGLGNRRAGTGKSEWRSWNPRIKLEAQMEKPETNANEPGCVWVSAFGFRHSDLILISSFAIRSLRLPLRLLAASIVATILRLVG